MTQPRRPVLHHRPLVERLEPRLPPGDTLLGLLLPSGLFDVTGADSSFIVLASSSARLAGAESAAADEAADDPPRPRQVNRGVEDSAPATPQEYVANWPPMWPRSLQAATPAQATGFNNPTRYVATRPDDQGVVPGGATTSRALASFPSSGQVARPESSTGVTPTAATPTPFKDSGRATPDFGSVPFYFEQNVGQADPSFDFVARGPGYTLGLSATEAVMAMPVPDDGASPHDIEQMTAEERAGLGPDGRPFGAKPPDPAEAPMVRMQIVGANPQGRAARVNPLVTKINYFIGNDPAQWHTNVPTFAKVQYDDVYPGIDLVYYSNQNQLEYDFIVAPDVDPSQVQLRFTGVDSAHIDAGGDLVLQVGDSEIRQQAPYIYQDLNGSREQVLGAFVLGNQQLATNTFNVGFVVGDYDTTRPLVIDPLVAYSTYLGGHNSDYAYDVAVDNTGSAYITGLAYSGFPNVNPALPYGGDGDAFVAKLSPNGSTLIYATYIGGDYVEAGGGIAVDGKGGAYVAGVTESTDFPTTPGAFQTTIGSGQCSGSDACADAFVIKLGPTGSSVVYSTFLGGLSYDAGDSIAVDAIGNAFIKGTTRSVDFPTLNPVQSTYAGGGCNEGAYYYLCNDAFITKLNANGTTLMYSTYLGGTRDEGFFYGEGGDIAVDTGGHAYVTGQTESNNFPIYNAIQPVSLDSPDVFVSKLTPDGSAFVYSTYLTGETGQVGHGIAADESGNAYVTGQVWSADYPTTLGSFQTVNSGNGDAFITKLNADGSAFVYSTFLGGANTDGGSMIDVDTAGNAYVTGLTTSAGFPTYHAFQPNLAAKIDAFVTKVSADGKKLAYSSYLGGSENDSAGGIALDSVGNAYVVGSTHSFNFPIHSAFQPAKAGLADGFVTKISERAFKQPLTATPIAP